MKWNFLRFLLPLFCLFFAVQPVFSGEALEDELMYGLDLFKEARYEQSLRLFQTVLDDPESSDLHGDALYWMSRSQLEMNELDAASRSLEDYLINYPGHSHNMDGRYYKGRLLFLENEFDSCIHFYSSFLTGFPNSPYYASSLFWIGESLYGMGRFDEAAEIYKTLLEKFPRSIKTEASRYRLSLIEYRYREEELLKMLQWSHEEFLKSTAEYEQKEKEFNQALEVYQGKLIELTNTREMYENKLKLLALKEEALRLKQSLLSGKGGSGAE